MSAGSAFLEEQRPSLAELDDLRPLASHVRSIGRGHVFHSGGKCGHTGAKFQIPPATMDVRKGDPVPHFDFNSVDPKCGAFGMMHTPTLPTTPSRKVNHDSLMLGNEFVAALQRICQPFRVVAQVDATERAALRGLLVLLRRYSEIVVNAPFWLHSLGCPAISVRSEAMA